MAANVILNIGGIAAGVLPLAFTQKPKDPMKQTSVSIGVGSGGSVPHIAIWGEDGARISQYKGDENGHICTGETWQTTVDNYQNGMSPANPTYVSVVMQEDDAICVAVISLSGNGQQWTWTGDMAYTCKAQWMESSYTLPGSNTPLRCAWLDADHTHDIIAKGLSLHIRDFTADPGLVTQHKDNTDRLCKNSARMTFWPDTQSDAVIPIFNPPLEYTRNTNENNPDPAAPDMSGGLKEPDFGKDRGNRAYPDGTDLKHWSIERKKRHTKDLKGRRSAWKRLSETLVVSHFPSHSAREVCEDPMSLSPDFVSVQEALFCDMTLRRLWPICSPTLTEDCFNIPELMIKAKKDHKRSATARKIYTKLYEWGLEHTKRALLTPLKTAKDPKNRLIPRIKKKHPGDRCNPKE